MNTWVIGGLSEGSLLLFPREALKLAFERYPLLRMPLLEELAREVSRSYALHSRKRIATAHGLKAPISSRFGRNEPFLENTDHLHE